MKHLDVSKANMKVLNKPSIDTAIMIEILK